jgi:hypothetical protein
VVEFEIKPFAISVIILHLKGKILTELKMLTFADFIRLSKKKMTKVES